MNTATVYKEDFMNLAMWGQVIKDLGLPADTDEIIVKAISHVTETQRQKDQKKGDKQSVVKTDPANPDPTIQIVISGGAVQSITKPAGVSLEIRDYDVDGADTDNADIYKQDEDGDWYQRMFWGENEAEG